MIEPTGPRLSTPILCLVTDLGVVDGDVSLLSNRVSIAVEHGVNMVQVRAPNIDGSDFDGLVERVVDAVQARALTIVNPSRRQISDYANVDGFQLAENTTVTISQIRDIFGSGPLVGRSIHSLDGALSAAASGVDYLLLGTIFPSGSHPGGTVHGSSIIRRVTEKTDVPVIGIGGISARNVGEVIASGARGIAVVRSILGATDPALATRELLEAMVDAACVQD